MCYRPAFAMASPSFRFASCALLLAPLAFLACARGVATGFGPELDDVDASADGAAADARPGATLPGDDGGDVDPGPGPGPADGSADATPPGDGGRDASPPVDAGQDSGPTCATTPPSNACGLTAQCGCAQNQTCAITSAGTGAVSCVSAGSTPSGNPCTTQSQCGRGLTCVFGACRPYCATENQACPGAAGTFCFAPEDQNGNTSPNLKVCTIACDPRTPATACGANACQWYPTERVSDCREAGPGAQYAACDYDFDCRAGYACGDHPFYGLECERWCRIGQNDCGAGEACYDVYGANAPVSGGVKLGLCQD